MAPDSLGALLPWDHPFRMIDRMVACVPHETITTTKLVSTGDAMGGALGAGGSPSAPALREAPQGDAPWSGDGAPSAGAPPAGVPQGGALSGGSPSAGAPRAGNPSTGTPSAGAPSPADAQSAARDPRDAGAGSVFPEMMILEGMGQSASLLYRLSYGEMAEARVPMLGYLKTVFHAPARPGDAITYVVRAVKMTSTMGLFEGRATIGGTLVAEAEFALGASGAAS